MEQVEFRIKRKLSRKRRPGDSKYKINGDPVLMATREIWREILIKASSSAVYEAVTEAKKLVHWWTTGARGESAIGKRVEFWFGEFCAGEMEVTVRKPHELVRWHVTPKAASDWVDTEVELKIFRVDKQTVLHFRHSNWHEGAKMFPHCSLGRFLAEPEGILWRRAAPNPISSIQGPHQVAQKLRKTMFPLKCGCPYS